jgi:thiol:disulfide interchange protein DsbD
MSFGWIDSWLAGSHVGVWALAFFLGGLALNLSPCVYPMIPVTMAFFSQQGKGRGRSIIWLGFLYVVGLSVSYSLLGLVAAQTGALFGSWLQQPIVLGGIAALIVVLALSLFGLYELQPPPWLLQRFGRATTGRWGAFLMGMSVGIIAAPCVGPVILALLLHVSHLANPLLGFGLFFIMGLGMGLPYLVLAVLTHRISHLPKAGPWLLWTKRALGVALLALALYMVRPLWSVRHHAMPVASASSVAWQPYSSAGLARAKTEGRVAIVDVYADWCIPCVELDHTTFHHPDVVERLRSVATLRIDATTEVEPAAQLLLDQSQIYGVPTVLVFDRHGKERTDLRVNGFVSPKELLERLDRLD